MRRALGSGGFRRYGDAFLAEVGAATSTAQRRVMTVIEQCPTAALGGHVEQCSLPLLAAARALDEAFQFGRRRFHEHQCDPGLRALFDAAHAGVRLG